MYLNMIRIAQTRFNLITRRLAAVINFHSGKNESKKKKNVNHRHCVITLLLNYRTRNTKRETERK